MSYSNMQPLPLWKPQVPQKFNAGMWQDSPFIVTQHLQRSDLGQCIISTTPPHFVAKIRAFKTYPDRKEGKDAYNKKQLDLTSKQEEMRCDYFNNRLQAENLAVMADQRGCSIKDLIESHADNEDAPLPRVYDEEFDEPRAIAKVPGLNVYLELFGCLDDIAEDQVQWDGPDGAYAVLKRMSLWAQNIWSREERRPRASHRDDQQLLPLWQEDYDESVRPTMAHKRGIGVWPDIDPSRRPELLHSKAPKFASADIDGICKIKADRAEQASKGIRK